MNTSLNISFWCLYRAVPVDNSPHTDGFYIVLVMERYNPERWDNIMKGTPLPDDEEYAKTIPKQKPTRKQLTTNHKTKKRRNKRKRAEQRKRDECLNYNYNPMDDEIMAVSHRVFYRLTDVFIRSSYAEFILCI